MTEKQIGEFVCTDIEGAKSILGLKSASAVHRLVRAEKQARKCAERSHKSHESHGIPFIQYVSGGALWFPIDGLREFVRARLHGMAF